MKFLPTLSLILIFTAGLLAQRANVKSSFVDFDGKKYDALQVDIDAESDEVIDRWEEFWDERYNIDVDREDRSKNAVIYLGEQVNMPLISQKNFDLYSKITRGERSATVSMAAAFSENDAVTEVSHPEAFRAARVVMEEFRTYFYTKHFDTRLTEVRDELEDLRDDSTDASEDADKARRKIEKYEDKIAKYREKIQDLRDEVGDELETAEEKAARARDLERQIRELEQQRSRYLG